MGRKRNKYYLSGKTKRVYRQNAARMRRERNSANANIVVEHDAHIVQSNANTETVRVSSLSEIILQRSNNIMNEQNPELQIKAFTCTTANWELGRRIIHVSHFFKELQIISSHGPLNCGLTSVEIVSEVRIGLTSKFTLKCNMCNLTFILESDNPVDEMDVNTSAVAGSIAIGCGYTQLNELTATIGLAPMSDKLFSKKMDLVNRKWAEELLKSISKAANEERNLAIEEGRVNSDGIPIIDVIADGCYGKRSYKKNYSSLSGAAAIIGKKTNKILFLGVKNKYCHICSLAQSKGVKAKDHLCYKNYTGPSTGMESEILVEGFKKSLEMHNLIYGRLISDGDASTYSKILQARPYDNYTVEKVECRNYLLRNLCNKLVAVTTDTKYFLKYRRYLTKKRILSIRKVVVDAIRTHKITGNITGLHEDIMNAPEHAFGRHSKCKKYFCSKNEDDTNLDEKLFYNSLWQRIKLIITHLAAHARSLIVDVDSNSVERYHSIVAKFVGGKRINFSQRYQYKMRCNAAALSFNTHKPLSILHKSIVGKSPRNEINRNEERKLKTRQNAQKYIRKKKRIFEKQDTRNYGEDCTKPDMEEEMMVNSKKVFLQNLQKNSEERERIARDTILQSGNSEWLELRRNILTASNFGRIIKRRMDVSCQNIVKDILYKKSIEHVPSIKHGKDHEKLALEQLSQQENIEILPCGLHIDPDVPYFGATPDGITNGGILVEMKCPKTSFDIGLEKAVDDKKIPFYKKGKDGNLQINKEHYWFYQVQGQLHVTRRTKCLFAIWSGEQFPVKTEIIEKDDNFWSTKMKKKLQDFYLDCLLPELIDPRYTRKLPIRDPKYVIDAIDERKEKQARKRKSDQGRGIIEKTKKLKR